MVYDDRVYPWQKEIPLRINSLKMKRILEQCSSEFDPVDRAYRCPELQWLIDVVGPEYEQQAFDNGLREYHAEQWDCDDRAMLYCTVAKGVHRNEMWSPNCGLAVGLVAYYIEGNVRNGHAICWAVVDNEGKPEMAFIDPGVNPAIVKLSDKEKKTLNRFYI